jgi:hypothetical protein
MSTEIRITKAQLGKLLKSDMDQLLERTVAAVNAAPAGHVIDGSEEAVRQAAAEFRRTLFEKAIQERANAAKAAFSPSGSAPRREVAIQGVGGGGSSDEQLDDSDRA